MSHNIRKALHHKLLRKGFYSRIVNNYFSDCSFILDVGCGRGHFLESVKNKIKVSVGVDLNESNLHECKSNGLSVVKSDIFYLPFKDNSFDGLFFSHVIEHIPNVEICKVFSEFHRISKGRLVIITPTQHSKFWTEGHIVTYDKYKLKATLHQNGYAVSRIFYDKCFIFRVQDNSIMLKCFNMLPFIWLRMNIIAIQLRVIQLVLLMHCR